MKNIVIAIIIVLNLMLCQTIYADVKPLHFDDKVGESIYTDIVCYINNKPITSYSYNNSMFVVVDDLNNYGFDVKWDGNLEILSIERNITKEITPSITMECIEQIEKNRSNKTTNVFYNKILVYIGNTVIPSYNFGGKIVINIKDLSLFGNLKWDAKEKAIKLNLSNIDDFVYDDGLGVKIRRNDVIIKSKDKIKKVNLVTILYDKQNKKNIYFDDIINNSDLGEGHFAMNDHVNELNKNGNIDYYYGDIDYYCLGSVIKNIECDKNNNLYIKKNDSYESELNYLESDRLKYFLTMEEYLINQDIQKENERKRQEFLNQLETAKPYIWNTYWIKTNSFNQSILDAYPLDSLNLNENKYPFTKNDFDLFIKLTIDDFVVVNNEYNYPKYYFIAIINGNKYRIPEEIILKANNKGNIFNKDPKILYKWSNKTWQKIKEGYIWVGMNEDMMLVMCGRPNDINRISGKWGTHEQWIYGSGDRYTSYYYFENGKLTSWQY